METDSKDFNGMNKQCKVQVLQQQKKKAGCRRLTLEIPPT
jgi:hypothetical protein